MTEFKKIKVELTGLSPLLMNNPESMLQKKDIEKKKKHYDNKIEAEKVAYRMKDKTLFIPARCMKRCFINASSLFKVKGKSLKPLIAGCTRIEPNQISLNTKNYKIDLQTVVIQGKDRIIRARPRLDKWKINFNIIYRSDVFTSKEVLMKMKEILYEAGLRFGLLDYRPQKLGEYGTFKVSKFKV